MIFTVIFHVYHYFDIYFSDVQRVPLCMFTYNINLIKLRFKLNNHALTKKML